MKGELIGRGRTAEVYAWDGDRALKLFHPWVPEEAVEEEYAATRAARDAGLPVPAAWGFARDSGRIGIVLDLVRGASMLSRLLDRPAEAPALLGEMARLQARLNSATFPDSIGSQRRRMERGIDKARALGAVERRRVRSILDGLPDGTAACHGDLHFDNVIVSEGGPVVIDWLCGARGNPLADLARSALLLRLGGSPTGIGRAARILVAASRPFLAASYERAYAALRPVDREELKGWALPVMAARLFEVEAYPKESRAIAAAIRRRLARSAAGDGIRRT